MRSIHFDGNVGAVHCCVLDFLKLSCFMPGTEVDRPLAVPEGAVNFAFIGQFAETEQDTIFTTDCSVRTGMEAVHTLLRA